MAKIVAEITKKLKGCCLENGEKENKFFGKVTKQNPKTHDSKEDPMSLEEWIRYTKKISDVMEVFDNKYVTTGAFYITG